VSLPRTESGALRFVATVPRGFADLLAENWARWAPAPFASSTGSVNFEGSLETGYRACLSRGSPAACR
jgi:hypothetical protein